MISAQVERDSCYNCCHRVEWVQNATCDLNWREMRSSWLTVPFSACKLKFFSMDLSMEWYGQVRLVVMLVWIWGHETHSYRNFYLSFLLIRYDLASRNWLFRSDFKPRWWLIQDWKLHHSCLLFLQCSSVGTLKCFIFHFNHIISLSTLRHMTEHLEMLFILVSL